MLVGCNDAQVVVVDARSLVRLGTLPRPSPIGVDMPVPAPPGASSGAVLSTQPMGLASASEQPTPNARYADTVALAYDATNRVLSAHYNDHSLLHWRLRSSTASPSSSYAPAFCEPNSNAASDLPDFALDYSRPSHTRAIWATDVRTCLQLCSYSDLLTYCPIQLKGEKFTVFGNSLQIVLYLMYSASMAFYFYSPIPFTIKKNWLTVSCSILKYLKYLWMCTGDAQVVPQYSVRRVTLPGGSASAVAPAASAVRASDVSSRSILTTASGSGGEQQELCVADMLFATCSADCTMRVWRLQLAPTASDAPAPAPDSPLSSPAQPTSAYPASTSCVSISLCAYGLSCLSLCVCTVDVMTLMR